MRPSTLSGDCKNRVGTNNCKYNLTNRRPTFQPELAYLKISNNDIYQTEENLQDVVECNDAEQHLDQPRSDFYNHQEVFQYQPILH
ncbi:hypothetical protein NQ317_006200 [Molorchus minor]|uniref:Uncharacterized protein n=1 Tax=Molorchus minor TaxID=1323400 RepID=A0ABQ9IU60_9CUCU|nr:hypothetical protein NQ317_006200 [Molorchus minor]